MDFFEALQRLLCYLKYRTLDAAYVEGEASGFMDTPALWEACGSPSITPAPTLAGMTGTFSGRAFGCKTTWGTNSRRDFGASFLHTFVVHQDDLLSGEQYAVLPTVGVLGAIRHFPATGASVPWSGPALTFSVVSTFVRVYEEPPGGSRVQISGPQQFIIDSREVTPADVTAAGVQPTANFFDQPITHRHLFTPTGNGHVYIEVEQVAEARAMGSASDVQIAGVGGTSGSMTLSVTSVRVQKTLVSDDVCAGLGFTGG